MPNINIHVDSTLTKKDIAMIEEVTDVGMIEGGGRVGTGRSRRGGYGGMLRHLHDINTYKYNLGREEEDSYHGWNGGNDRGRGGEEM